MFFQNSWWKITDRRPAMAKWCITGVIRAPFRHRGAACSSSANGHEF
jgi:hypothetical protein